MRERAQAIDVLRCLAIVGMVLSGQMLWNAELPAWLFHAQIPPPNFQFDPSVAGITWVDLVFPFFLFSMGAAFPLALRRRMERGVGAGRIMLDTAVRWAALSLFAIALANTRAAAGALEWKAAGELLLLATWGLFFAMFARIPKLSARSGRALNLAGAAGLIGLLMLCTLIPGADAGVRKSDIIILLLALMVLSGTPIWYLTRDNVPLRLGVMAVLVALRISASVPGSWNEALWDLSPAGWLFRFDYLKYLCVVIPGTIAGDVVWRWMRRPERHLAETGSAPARWAAAATAGLVVFVVWALLARHTALCAGVSAAAGAAILWLYKKDGSSTGKLHRALFAWGLLWLTLGLALEACEGGIKKDHATYSYFFTTAGLASMTVAWLSSLINLWRVKTGFLARCGRNPMIAYTVSGFLIAPLLGLTHAERLLDAMAEAGPWWGVARGAAITALMMILTVWFTNKKIFWKT